MAEIKNNFWRYTIGREGCKGEKIMKYIRIYTFLSMLVFCTSGKGQNKFDWDSETASQGVRIQNSLPVGMGSLDSSGRTGYTDFTGKFFGYLIFFSRIIIQKHHQCICYVVAFDSKNFLPIVKMRSVFHATGKAYMATVTSA